MKYDEYVVARRRRLIEHAVELGCTEDEATAQVDAVLADRRRRIEKAKDPDPEVYDALERALRGPSPHRRTAWLGLVAVGVAIVLGTGVWWVTRPAEQVTVPSLFTYGAGEAAAVLQKAGLESRLKTVPVCEPRGLVLGSAPPAGTKVDIGSVVVLRSAISPDDECVGLADRTAAWAFLRFVRGGAAPRLDDTVFVSLNAREPAVLPAAAAADPQRWGAIQDIADVAALPGRGASGSPKLTVTLGVPPPEQCGVPRPDSAGDRETLRLQIEPGADGSSPCPFTVDLYRDREGVIDAVVVYSANYDAVSKWSGGPGNG